MTFAALWLAYLLMSVAYSILAPFYPQEAAVFDVGSLTVGMVMGSAPLCVVFLSPIFGYFVPQIGLKFMLIAGSFLVGGSVVLLGFLMDMTSKWEFVMYSVLLRIVEGIGTAGYATGSFTIATLLYPSHTGTVVGLLEVGSGLGFVAGPPLGGILYNYGGFILPFVVTGGCVLLFVPFFICIIPRTDDKKQHMPYRTIGKLLLDIPFLLLLLCNVIVIAALGYFGPIMSPFLISKFKLSPIGIGIVFLIGPLFYMLSSIVVGKLSDILVRHANSCALLNTILLPISIILQLTFL
jgi:MFS family permease